MEKSMNQDLQNPEFEKEIIKEPDDYYHYRSIHLHQESIDLFIASLSFYLEILDGEIKLIKEVSAFTSLVSEENEASPLIRERNKVLNLIEWLN